MSYLIPTRFRLFRKKFKGTAFNLLDVGCGSHSPSITKKWFPLCNYYGVDHTRNYANDTEDFEVMSQFYEIELQTAEFREIHENYFDVMLMSHIIEHLPNGDMVLSKLIPKLKKNGTLYIEFPSTRSTKLPSMRGSLNFYDDPTHCRLYTIEELSKVLNENDCRVLKSGTRRDWMRILILPFHIIYSKKKFGYVSGSVFWDLLGFADFIYAQRR